MMLILGGCNSKKENSTNAPKKESSAKVSEERLIAGTDYDKEAGADSYANSGDNKDSRYFKNPDFYDMKSDENLIIIQNFKTMQQTTEWSCGNATALMVLEHLKISGHDEMELATLMNSSVDKETKGAKPGSANNFHEYGTNVEGMVKGLEQIDGVKIVETNYKKDIKDEDLYKESDGVSTSDVGNLKRTFSYNSLYASENKDGTDKFVSDAKDSYFVKWLTYHLKNNRPIMVEWADWDGHWQAIIGYDNNGTPGVGDDMLIFADPYDTSDHAQDGYFVFPLERWFNMWNDRKVAAKPYQLQSYVIIDKAN